MILTEDKKTELLKRMMSSELENKDKVTLTLKPHNNGWKWGGRLLKNDIISEKQYRRVYRSGERYEVVKVKDNKVLITDYHHLFLWVDIDEISLPYERQNDSELKEHYELLDDELVFEIEVPKTIKVSYKDFYRYNYGSGNIWKPLRVVDGELPKEIPDYQIEMWKSLFNNFGNDTKLPTLQKVEEVVKNHLLNKIVHSYEEQRIKVDKNRHSEVN